jgi:hypothetical protein
MVAMRSAKAAIAHSMSTRDLINLTPQIIQLDDAPGFLLAYTIHPSSRALSLAAFQARA